VKKKAVRLPNGGEMVLFGEMKRLASHWQILVALVLATLTALVLRGLFDDAGENSAAGRFLAGALETCRFVGDLFMRGLKMIIVPLIVTAVVSGITGMKGVEGFGRLGLKTVSFYMLSSLVAITVGLVVVNTVKPGLVDGAANEAMITVTKWIMAVAPIGVYALILPVVYETGADLFKQLGKYFFCVLFALAFHLFVILPMAVKYLGKTSPLAHFKAMRPALLMAFSTASSSATLPVTMRAVQENAGVSKRVSSFTLPLGSTVNMDGTALYECVAVIFVAQVMGIELGLGAQFFIVIAALLTSVGVAGIPSASLVAILLILKNSGIPNAETAVVALLSVDRLLDMSRTAVNVFSDTCAAVIVARSEGEVLERGL
jgi:Na+/H+-dicarboxylate symporter